ncbi:MAG: hypothetical protein C0609_00915 [Deltaproteobacteria bacterium]|nr:MAG: hypothetical protein C0609_00915 [Deltaproteobacteria bacterium]
MNLTSGPWQKRKMFNSGRRTLLLLLLAFSLLAPTALAFADVRILLYHRVGDSRYPSTNVDKETFRLQMRYLADEGYAVITTRALEEHLLNGAKIPERAAVIHFDDGFLSVYENAYPILREFGYPFAIFIPTRALDKSYGDYMSWDMVSELAGEGVEFGVHGMDHLRLGLPKDGDTPKAYSERIASELGGGMERFRALNLAPRWVAYPYGEYNQEVMESARKLGYELGFAQDPGAVPQGGDPFMVPRFAVVGTVSDMATFKERVGYEPLSLADMRPPPGIVEGGETASFGADISSPELYGSGVNLFVSELGRVDAKVDFGEGVITAPGATLKRRMDRVLISMRNKKTGRYALASWVLMNR